MTQQQLVALHPSDLPATQAQLTTWCRGKILALAAELREQRTNLRDAKRLKWKHSGWQAAVTRTKRRMIYYAKIKRAIEAGYLIVPNFNVDVIAVRTARRAPVEEKAVHTATPQILPPGQGRYVDDRLIGRTDSEDYTDANGKARTREWFVPTAYDETLDFPIAMVQPAVLEATQIAMARRIFDRIGVVAHGRRSDPIVVGQVIDPATTSKWALRSNPRCVTFFIAWWLDVRDL